MTLPGLQGRIRALGQLPALGLITLAGSLPQGWTCSYTSVDRWTEGLVEQLAEEQPDLVAASALTASINEAYEFCAHARRQNLRTVLGGLHVTCCADEAS